MGLRFVLLALLSKEPNTGYGMGRVLHHELSHVWDARLQQIYGELAKLQRQGLVEAERVDLPNRPAKKVYSLTPEGEQALDRWLAERSLPVSSKDDLLVRLWCLPRMTQELLVRRLEERQDECEKRVRGLRQKLAQVRQTDPAELGYRLTLEAALGQAEAQAAWCARALSLVGESAERPARPLRQPAVRAAGA